MFYSLFFNQYLSKYDKIIYSPQSCTLDENAVLRKNISRIKFDTNLHFCISRGEKFIILHSSLKEIN